MTSAQIIDNKLTLTGPGIFQVSKPVGEEIQVDEGKVRTRTLPEGVSLSNVSTDEQGNIDVRLALPPAADELPPEIEPELVEPEVTVPLDEIEVINGKAQFTREGVYHCPDGCSVQVAPRSRRSMDVPEGATVQAVEYRPGLFQVSINGVAPEMPEPGRVYRRSTYRGQTISRDAGLVFFGATDQSEFMGIGPDTINEDI